MDIYRSCLGAGSGHWYLGTDSLTLRGRLWPAVSKGAAPGSAARVAMVRDARALPVLLTMRPKELGQGHSQ
jgi:hypothetical protein